MNYSIIDILEHPQLLGQFLKDPATWRGWFTMFRAFFALPPVDGDMEIYQAATGRTVWPTTPADELWCICGRRGGKSTAIALLAAYLARFREYDLSPGETGQLVIVSPTRDQSTVIKGYLSAYFNDNLVLKKEVEHETAWQIDLKNRVSIRIKASDGKSLRAPTLVAAIVDEAAFLNVEGSKPDTEIIRALRPGLHTLNGPLLVISSPYAKRGALYQAYKDHYGKNDSHALVWQLPSLQMNPTLSADRIARDKENDPEAAAAEWDAQFRSDIETFISREVVEAVVIPGRFELPYVAGIQYTVFVDAAGGSGQDSMTMGIAHKDGNERRVLDLIRERKPPFSPDDVVREFASVLKQYRIFQVIGDRYAGDWPGERFKEHGIGYKPSDRTKSDLYRELLPLVNSGEAELLDNKKLVDQLCNLERRTGRSGRDSIDHGPGGHDDVINVAAGALVECKPRKTWGVWGTDEPGLTSRTPKEPWAVSGNEAINRARLNLILRGIR